MSISKRVIKKAEAAAASKARAELLFELIQQQEKHVKLGLHRVIPDTVVSEWKGEHRKAMSEYHEAAKALYVANLEATAHDIARAAGCLNASIAAQVVVDAVSVEKKSNGELSHSLRDPVHGLPCDIPSFIGAMRKSKDYGMLFDGADSRNNGEANPWDRKTFNLTAQGRIATEDPAKAKRLKAEAGVK